MTQSEFASIDFRDDGLDVFLGNQQTYFGKYLECPSAPARLAAFFDHNYNVRNTLVKQNKEKNNILPEG